MNSALLRLLHLRSATVRNDVCIDWLAGGKQMEGAMYPL